MILFVTSLLKDLVISTWGILGKKSRKYENREHEKEKASVTWFRITGKTKLLPNFGAG